MGFLLLALLLTGPVLVGDVFVMDPVAAYKAQKHLEASDVLYRWKADIDGDGKEEVFLDFKDGYKEDRQSGETPSWRVYLADKNGAGYKRSGGTDFGRGVGPALPKIDPARLFVGQIDELKKHGLVTMTEDHPRSGGSVRRVVAYTVQGDHLRQTRLVEYDPSAYNAIYHHYLAGERRAHVQLEEVVP